MASVSISLLILILTIQIHTLLSTHPPTPKATTPVPPSSICQNTQFPSYCRNVLQSDRNKTATVYEYGRFSFKRSLSQAAKFLRLINNYLSRSHKLNLTPSAVRALQDCQLLAELNLDFFSTSSQAVQSTSQTLPFMTSDDVQTLLSGVLTNQQTCLDGLTSADGITTPSSDDSKLYSISLSLFTKAWAPNKKRAWGPNGGRKHSAFRHGRLPRLSMLAQARARLVQTTEDEGDDDDQVVISDVVTVSQDGSGNFTHINDAVAAAPNKSDGSDGYFLIYVAAGVYEENVIVDKKKRYVMMIGDGINQTIITGNRSVVDNYTTFNSATFGCFDAKGVNKKKVSGEN